MLTVFDPLCNHLCDPRGVALPLLFTWRLGSERAGARQASFNIVVTSITMGEQRWDSGLVTSADQRMAYAGDPLEPDEICTWFLTVTDDAGDTSYSVPAAFQMATRADATDAGSVAGAAGVARPWSSQPAARAMGVRDLRRAGLVHTSDPKLDRVANGPWPNMERDLWSYVPVAALAYDVEAYARERALFGAPGDKSGQGSPWAAHADKIVRQLDWIYGPCGQAGSTGSADATEVPRDVLPDGEGLPEGPAALAWTWGRALGLSATSPGYHTVRIRPDLACGLAHASGSLLTPHGLVCVSWRIVDGAAKVEVSLPPHATGTVELGGRSHEIVSGRHEFAVGAPSIG